MATFPAGSRLLAELLDPARAIASRSTNQVLTTGVAATASFTTEIVDTAAMFAPTSDTITIASGKGGQYSVAGWAQIGAGATGIRVVEILQNGSIVLSQAANAPSAGTARLTLANEFVAAAGDTFKLQVFQNNGGNLNLEFARLSVRLVGQ